MVRTEEIKRAVPEEGTAIFRIVCTDENGDAAIPATMFWDLTSLDGTVIVYNQEITELASTIYLPVFGTNLRILDGETSYGERLITFRGTYNSVLGNNLPIHKQIKFSVQNLKLVAYPITVNSIDTVFTDDAVEAA